MAKTVLTPDQLKGLASIGAPIAEVRDLASDGYSFDDIQSIYEAQRESRQADKLQTATDAAKAQDDITNKNRPHPGISPFSYPDGDVLRPRDKILSSEVIWVVEEITPDLSTAEELELLEQLQPGRYLATRSDLSKMAVTVSVELDEVTGKPRRKKVWFDTRGPLKNSLTSKVAICREIIAQQKTVELVTA